MSKEAMKLALEALEDTLSDDPYPYSLESKAITALREALAEPDFWEGYVPEPVKPAPAPGYCKQCKQYSIEEPLPAQRIWVEVEQVKWEGDRLIAKLKEKNT